MGFWIYEAAPVKYVEIYGGNCVSETLIYYFTGENKKSKLVVNFATKMNFLKRKMCLIWNSIRRINVLSRISSFCFQTFGLSLSFFSFFSFFLRPLRTSSDQIRTVDVPGMRIGRRWKPCQPAVIVSHIYTDSLLRLLTLAPGFSGMSSALPWPLATPTSLPTQEELLLWLLEIDRETFNRFYAK